MSVNFGDAGGSPVSVRSSRGGSFYEPLIDILDGEDAALVNQQKTESTGCWARKSTGAKVGIVTCIVFLLLTLCAGITVVFFAPEIASALMNSASLSFTHLELSEPFTMDSCRMIATSTLGSIGPIDATSDASQLEIYYNNAYVGHLPMPGLTVHANKGTTINIDDTFVVVDKDAFDAYAAALLRKDKVQWTVKAKVPVHATILGITASVTVSMMKEMVVTGINNFPNVQVTHTDLTQSTGNQLRAGLTISLPNPSILSLTPMGELRLEAYYQDYYVGYIFGADPEFGLVPGDNAVEATLVIEPVNTTDTRVSELFSLLLQGETVNVEARAGENATSVGLLQNAFEGITLTAQQALIPLPQFVNATEIRSGNILLDKNDLYSMNLTAILDIEMNAILGDNSPFSVTELSAVLFLASIRDPTVQLVSQYTSETVYVNQTEVNKITIDDACHGKILDFETITSFMMDFVKNESITVILTGSVSAHMTTVIGEMYLYEVPITITTSLLGLNDLKTAHLTLDHLDLVQGHETYLECVGITSTSNPSPLGLILGDASVTPLAFFVDGIKVAEGSLPGFEFPNGNYSKSYPTNLLQTLAPNATLTEDIFSSFVMGNDVQMVMQGQGSDDFPYMSDVIKAMSADVLVKGNTVPLLLKATMSPDLVDTFKGIVPTALKIENPFSEQVLITGCDLGVYFKGTEVGYITEQFGDDPIVIPASGTMDTRDLDVDLIMSWTTFLAMIEGLVSVKLDVSGTLDFQVDEFIGKNVYYEQLQIPSSIWSSTPDNATLA